MFERHSAKNLDIFKLVFDFTNSLQLYNEITWSDKYGITLVCIGRNLVTKLIQEWNINSSSYAVILSPLIKGQAPFPLGRRLTNNSLKKVNYILSIGGAREHNVAKELLFKANERNKSELVTVPLPLSNDSFGTNRSSPNFGKVEVPSRETLYPSIIIIDLDLLNNINESLNVLGIGEVIGLYYSLWDYYSIRNLSPPRSLISNIERSIYDLTISLKSDKIIWLKLLATCLIEKCLIMRQARDNQIGAAGDHLIAYALKYNSRNCKDKNYKRYSHGKLVYLGSVAMAGLFPEWEYRFFSLENLINLGIEIGLLDYSDLNLLVDKLKNRLITLALQMRPNRLTYLITVSSNRIRKAWLRINKHLEKL